MYMSDSYIDDLTLQDLMYFKGTPNNRYSKIRNRAKAYFSIIPENLRKCQICNYDKHVQMCHKKSIGSFTLDTLVSVINDPNNLIMLCPNCHWELDHDLLNISNDCISSKCVFPPSGKIPKTNRQYNTCLCGNKKTKEAKVCISCHKSECKNIILNLKQNGQCNLPKNNSGRYTKICIDCGTKISKLSQRCKSCAAFSFSIKRQKIQWPLTEDLINMVKNSSYVAVAKKLGISDQAVHKRIRNHS
jgi:hypothetical protein